NGRGSLPSPPSNTHAPRAHPRSSDLPPSFASATRLRGSVRAITPASLMGHGGGDEQSPPPRGSCAGQEPCGVHGVLPRARRADPEPPPRARGSRLSAALRRAADPRREGGCWEGQVHARESEEGGARVLLHGVAGHRGGGGTARG